MSNPTQLNSAGHLVTGTVAEVATVSCLQWLDTAKFNKMNGRPQPALLSKDVFSLYAGAVPRLCAAPLEAGVPFLVKGTLANYFSKDGKLSDARSFGVAAATGPIASVFLVPFCRVVNAQQAGIGTKNVLEAFRAARGSLYKAAVPQTIRETTSFIGIFALRERFEKALSQYSSNETVNTVVSGLTVGAAAGLLSNTADVVTQRMGGDFKGEYPSLLSTLKQVHKERAYLKGSPFRIGLLSGTTLVYALVEKKFPQFLPGAFYHKKLPQPA